MIVKLYLVKSHMVLLSNTGFLKGGDFCQLRGENLKFWEKKVFVVYISNFETCTRYFGVADEKKKTNKY